MIRYNKLKMERLKQLYSTNDIFKDDINISILFNDFIKQPIINHINLIDLSSGKYQTDKSNSDNAYSKSIKFFINNLHSFKKNNHNNLDFIYNNFNILILEYLEYYLKKKLRLSTFKLKLSAILRVLYLMFDNKDFELYKNISIVQDNITNVINHKEGNNIRDDLEESRHIDFSLILKRRDDIEHMFNNITDKFTKTAYDINQDLILLSLYTLLPPERCELLNLSFCLSPPTDNNIDYIFIQNNKCSLLLNKIKKNHSSIIINIYDECLKLNDLLIQSYNLYNRVNVFTSKNKYPILISVKPYNIANRFKTIFKDYNKNIGINAIRSSYISYFLNNPCITYNQKQLLAQKMRTSIKQLEKNYKKIDTLPHNIINPNPIPINVVKFPKTEKEIMKSYYEKSKDKIAKQQKIYRQNRNIPAYRIKLLRKLNTDKNYINKTTKEILNKYNILQNENGIYY